MSTWWISRCRNSSSRMAEEYSTSMTVRSRIPVFSDRSGCPSKFFISGAVRTGAIFRFFRQVSTIPSVGLISSLWVAVKCSNSRFTGLIFKDLLSIAMGWAITVILIIKNHLIGYLPKIKQFPVLQISPEQVQSLTVSFNGGFCIAQGFQVIFELCDGQQNVQYFDPLSPPALFPALKLLLVVFFF